jgi:dTDP-4-dehydrorhamnose 3,5-epimerase
VLSAKKPSVLFIPPGYANGFMSLTAQLKLMFFSTSTLEESAGDDIRFDSRLWDPWHVAER